LSGTAEEGAQREAKRERKEIQKFEKRIPPWILAVIQLPSKQVSKLNKNFKASHTGGKKRGPEKTKGQSGENSQPLLYKLELKKNSQPLLH
jgi:hypothetical protein